MRTWLGRLIEIIRALPLMLAGVLFGLVWALCGIFMSKADKADHP